MNEQGLASEYQSLFPKVERLRIAMAEQLQLLLSGNRITLGVPLESRVKSWDSIEQKIERRSLDLTTLTALPDLLGVRLILLFRRDLDCVRRLIKDNFDLLSSEDTSTRLESTQFGYQSWHFVVKLPTAWLSVPSLADLGDLRAEFQVRTLAQHIWAAASHELQYKQEANVPPPIRRAIHRVSALLETVDLEFDRVLAERAAYVAQASPSTSVDSLNVDLLAAVLDEEFPVKNKVNDEDYDEVVNELLAFGTGTAKDLRKLIEKHREAVLEADRRRVIESHEDNYAGTTKERSRAGVFFSHSGLIRKVLRQEYGEEYGKYLSARFPDPID